MEVPFGRPDLLTPQERDKVKPLYHPPVEPPHNLKKDIYDREKLKHVDDFVSKTPAKILVGTLKQFVDHVCSNKDWTDMEKFWALFSWVTSQPSRFTQVLKSHTPATSPYGLFVQFNNGWLLMDPILEAACHLARIPCYTVDGNTKASVDYEQGEPMDWDILTHWNIVHVAGSWRIVHTRFCSCSLQGHVSDKWTEIERDGKRTHENKKASKGVLVYRFNDEYFMPDPEPFKWVFFPVGDPKWQLSHTPLTQKEFENHFFVKRHFFEFGMKEIPETVISSVTESKQGKLVLPFGLTPPKSQGLRFSYILYRKREEHQRRKNLDGVLERYVFFEHRDDFFKFYIRFPIESRYKIEISATSPDTFFIHFCCSYVIDCTERMEECNPLPPCPAIGYGVVPATKEAGLTPADHTQAEVTTKTGYLEIRLTREKAMALHQMLKNSAIDEATLLQYTLTETVGDEVIIYLRLPKKGEYAINLYAQEPLQSGKADNVLNYLIQCQNTHTDVRPFPNITTGRLGRDEMMCNQLSVNAISHTQGTIRCGSGTVTFTFEKRSGFESSLFVELHSCDTSALEAATQEVTQGDRDCQVKLDIPEDGEYGLNVFCQNKPGQLHNVHSYLITKKGNEAKVKKAQGTDKVSTIPTKVLRTSRSQLNIAIPKGCDDPVAELHRRNGNSYPGLHKLSQITRGKSKMLTVDLATMGDYMLTLFDMDKMRFLVRAVHRYLIEFAAIPGADVINLETLLDDAPEDKAAVVVEPPTAEEKLDMYRRQMDKCRKFDRVDQLKKLVKLFLKEGGEEDDEALVKARHHLKVHGAREALEAACTGHDINAIDKAIPRAKKVNRHGELSTQIADAQKLRERLDRVNKRRHKILSMGPRTISEIKHYQHPPAGVHECMSATCNLLGYEGGDYEKWQKVQGLLSRSGQESLWSKIQTSDPSRIPEPTAERSKTFIKPFTRSQIRDSSAGAAAFFVWSKAMIKEIRDEHKRKKKANKEGRETSASPRRALSAPNGQQETSTQREQKSTQREQKSTQQEKSPRREKEKSQRPQISPRREQTSLRREQTSLRREQEKSMRREKSPRREMSPRRAQTSLSLRREQTSLRQKQTPGRREKSPRREPDKQQHYRANSKRL